MVYDKQTELLQDIKILLENNLDNMMKFSECADYLGFSKAYLYKLVREKRIPFCKPNKGQLYFFKSDIDKWIKGKQ